MHIYIYTNAALQIYTYIVYHADVYTRINISNTHIYVSYTHICICICTCIYIYVYIYIHIYAYIYVYIYIPPLPQTSFARVPERICTCLCAIIG